MWVSGKYHSPHLIFNKIMNIVGNVENRYRFEVVKLVEHAVIPTKSHDGDLGWDLYAGEQVSLAPNSRVLVSTGVKIKFPYEYGALIKDRSSISSKFGIFTHAGVLDSGYRGEIKILMHNTGEQFITFYRGDKVAQMVLIPVVHIRGGLVEVDELTDEYTTSRGDSGFGSTGG
jgi:dUTP pyrophosphatase